MKAKKIVHYKIMFSTTFPAEHPRKGQCTYFKDKIELAMRKTAFVSCGIIEHDKPGIIHLEPKLHTIRNNYELWKKRIAKVHAGEAVIDLCYWELPGGRYRPGNQAWSFATLDKDSGCGVQELQYGFDKTLIPELAKNDGLSLEDFKAWFKNKDISQPMAIIQFTNFRY